MSEWKEKYHIVYFSVLATLDILPTSHACMHTNCFSWLLSLLLILFPNIAVYFTALLQKLHCIYFLSPTEDELNIYVFFN